MPFITITYPPKYPLTESEKKWLDERARRCAYFCIHSSDGRRDFPCLDWWHSPNNCPLEGAQDFRDVAAFEARVAARLAWENCPCKRPRFFECAKITARDRKDVVRCRLKHARLAVEEEMQ